MIGRGLLETPDLVARLQGKPPASAAQAAAFSPTCFLKDTGKQSPEDRNVLFKMKEFWELFWKEFSGKRKELKKIKKAKDLRTYQETGRVCS